jgi:thiol-disulfide isomerase/thioredoxin
MKLKFGFPGKLLSKGKEKEQLFCPYCPMRTPPPAMDGLWKDFKLSIIIFIVAVIILLTNILSYAQEQNIAPLKTGEKMPDMEFPDVLNTANIPLKLADYKDRLLILDFWFTGCGDCIEDMPVFAALQKRYGDKIKIIHVDYEKPDRILKFYERFPNLKELGFPVIYNDVVLKKMFPHIWAPHVIWIDHGVFIAATEDDYLNSKNIDSVLNKHNVNLPAKVDIPLWDFSKPLNNFDYQGNLRTVARVYGATLTGYVETLGPATRMVTDKQTGDLRLDLINQSVLNLYTYILKSGLPMTANRRILEVADRSKYLNEPPIYDDVWMRLHSHSFEAIVPKGVTRDQILEQLRVLVETELGVSGAIKKVETGVLVIRLRGGGPPPSRYDKSNDQLYPGYPIYLHRTNVSHIAELMNIHENMAPVIDESGYRQFFDMELSAVPQDEQSWRKVLAPYGLEVIACKRPIEMFVLTETGQTPVFALPKTEKPLTN